MNALRTPSKQIFGNRYMLEVCVKIARQAPDRVSLTSLIGDSELSPSLYSAPLQRLTKSGLLRDLGRSGDHRTRWYEPAPSKFWELTVDLAESLSEGGTS